MRLKRFLSIPALVISAAFLIVLISSGPARAATTWTVTSSPDDATATPSNCPGTSCSLRDAIAAAQPGDTITFDPSVTSPITLTSALPTISKDLTITGPGAALLTISGNNTYQIFDIASGTVSISGLTISNGLGSITGNGGGIYNAGTLTVSSSTLSGNMAEGVGKGGGGIYNAGTLTVTNSTLSGNSAADGGGYGGGIYNAGTLTVTNSTLSGNMANYSLYGGGGIFAYTGTVTVTNSTLSGNSATSGYGGGIYVYTGKVTVTNSTLSGNWANEGGGVVNFGTVTVTNSTLSGNKANYGGGIDNLRTLTVTNSTLSGNSTADGGYGGGIFNDGTATLSNTIVANSTWGGDCVNYGKINAQNSLIQDSLGCVNGTNSNNLTGDPKLGVLADNGGPTETMALEAGSTAIDAGSNSLAVDADGKPLSYDQRGSGYNRIVNGTVDMGAYETGNHVLVVDTTDDTDLETCSTSPDDCSLRGAITLANTLGGHTTITFDSTVFATQQTITLTSALPTISGDLTITGPGADKLTIDGAGSYQIFNISTGITVGISGLTISNGHTSAGVIVLLSRGGGSAIKNSGTVTVTNCILSGNTGGAIYNAGTLTVTNSTFDGNSANSGHIGVGGGIYAYSGTLTVTNTTFSGNSADDGGAIFLNAAALTVTNSTFDGNSATSGYGGGAIYAYSGILTVTNSTLSGNGAAAGGGLFNDVAGDSTLINTIVANSTSGRDCKNNGGFIDAQNSLIEDGSCGITNGVNGNLTGDPLLDPNGPQDNGGATETIALLPGSPAIDAGDDTVCGEAVGSPDYGAGGLDQRGVSRPQGAHCDMGAFESRGFTFGTLTGTPQAAVINTAFGTPLGVTVQSASGEPVDGGVITFTAPSSGASTTFAPQTTATITGGAVSLSVTANGTGGLYTVTASGSGASGNASFSLMNILPPVVTAVSPYVGPTAGGTTVTITGSNFTNVTDVKFGGTNASGYTVDSSTQITTTSPSGAAGIVDITVTTTAGTSATSSADQFGYYVPPPAVTAINPGGGTTGGGTAVTITGTGFTGATGVKFGGTDAASYTVNSDTSITAITPPGTAGTVDVTVTTSVGTSDTSTADQFVYCDGRSITVTNAGDSGAATLRQAITDVCDGGTISFSGDMTVSLTSGELAIDRDLTIDGAPHAVTIDAGNNSRAFDIAAGTVNLTDLTIKGGNAGSGGSGGGIYNDSGTLTVTSCTLSGNTAGYGGGAYNNSGNLTVTSCTLSGNSASYGGGVINFGTLTVNSSTVSGNTATNDGGGIYEGGDSLTVTNSTLSGNSAGSGDGGGIASLYGTSQVTNCTLNGNSASGVGGGIYGYSSVSVSNTILAGSTSGGNCSGAITDGGYNIDDGTTCGFGSGSLSNTDPLLDQAGLQDNGGATETIALLPGSPAIDAIPSDTNGCGTTTAEDQRGTFRPQSGACDIGAFESQGFTFGTPTGASQYTVVSTAFGTPLGITVQSAFGEPVDGGVITFTAPSSGASTSPYQNTATITGGAVSLSVTANGMEGSYTVTAGGSGVSGSASFSLMNVASSYTLSVQPSGTGTGIVRGSGAIGCIMNASGTYGTCSDDYAYNAGFDLTETPGSCSFFTGWSGACVGNGTSCSGTIAGNTLEDADFDLYPLACDTQQCQTGYGTLSDGYNNAGEDTTIYLQAHDFNETLTLGNPVDVTFDSGWNCDYTAYSGNTTITGLSVEQGSLTLQGNALVIGP